jgi:catechol 2,3-dioxygenase-like lactoylglutathione lyase family enzyme
MVAPMSSGLLRAVDAVTVRVPDLDAGIVFYGETLGHQLSWRNDEIGQAGLQTPDSSTEIVLTTEHDYEPSWLVESVPDAVTRIVGGGG